MSVNWNKQHVGRMHFDEIKNSTHQAMLMVSTYTIFAACFTQACFIAPACSYIPSALSPNDGGVFRRMHKRSKSIEI